MWVPLIRMEVSKLQKSLVGTGRFFMLIFIIFLRGVSFAFIDTASNKAGIV
jgi:hypothetical protein